MNPLSATPGPKADLALDLLSGPLPAAGDAASGFADALQRATGNGRVGVAGQSRTDRAQRTDSAQTKPERASPDDVAPEEANRLAAPETGHAAGQAGRDALAEDDAEAARDPMILAGMSQAALPPDAAPVASHGDAAELAVDEASEALAPNGARLAGAASAARAQDAPATPMDGPDAARAEATSAKTGPAAGTPAGREGASVSGPETARPDVAQPGVARGDNRGADASRARNTGAAAEPVAVEGDGTGGPRRADRSDPAPAAARAASSGAAAAAQAGVPPATGKFADAAPSGSTARRPGTATGATPAIGRATGQPDAATTRAAATGRSTAAARATTEGLTGPAPTDARDPQSTDATAPAAAGAMPAGDDGSGAASLTSADAASPVANAQGSTMTPGAMRPVALPVAAPVFSPAFPQALGQQLVMALRMELGQAELILSPAELGPVRIELSLDGNAASVQFAAPNADTRQALEQSLADLRDLLAEHGLSLADTHVGPGFSRDGDQRPTDGTAPPRSGRHAASTIDAGQRPIGMPARPDALVDLFA